MPYQRRKRTKINISKHKDIQRSHSYFRVYCKLNEYLVVSLCVQAHGVVEADIDFGQLMEIPSVQNFEWIKTCLKTIHLIILKRNLADQNLGKSNLSNNFDMKSQNSHLRLFYILLVILLIKQILQTMRSNITNFIFKYKRGTPTNSFMSQACNEA